MDNMIKKFKKGVIFLYKTTSYNFFPTTLQRNHKKWVDIKGNITLRLNYNLKPDSLVFDLGGYQGEWASDIFSKHLCNIFIFEPVKKYANFIKKRFENNNKLKVFNFGFSDKNKKISVSLEEDSTSTYNNKGNKTRIELQKVSEFIKKKKIKCIDLMKLNIEGEEYNVLEDLITTKNIKKIKDIQIQFHNFVPNAKERMKKIQNELMKTHKLTYNYEYIWENWTLKKG